MSSTATLYPRVCYDLQQVPTRLKALGATEAYLHEYAVLQNTSQSSNTRFVSARRNSLGLGSHQARLQGEPEKAENVQASI
jgi:hypothetical protein